MKTKTNKKETNMNEITINGTVYVPKSQVANTDGMEYVIVRTYSAGVHAGYLESRNGKEVTLRNSRRIWYWKGAASLSQMAVGGVSYPDECKFSVPVDKIILTEAIEIIPCTIRAMDNIKRVVEEESIIPSDGYSYGHGSGHASGSGDGYGSSDAVRLVLRIDNCNQNAR
jgi:hypothetical protein